MEFIVGAWLQRKYPDILALITNLLYFRIIELIVGANKNTFSSPLNFAFLNSWYSSEENLHNFLSKVAAFLIVDFRCRRCCCSTFANFFQRKGRCKYGSIPWSNGHWWQENEKKNQICKTWSLREPFGPNFKTYLWLCASLCDISLVLTITIIINGVSV